MSAILNFLGSFLRIVTWKDIVDVLIIAWLLYRFLKIIRGTNVVRLLRGIAILLVMTALSGLLGLRIINYILVHTVQLGLIALVIIFQPELRKFLEKFGKNRFQIFKSGEEARQQSDLAILQTVEAVKDMSLSKTGALIVYQRNDDLSEITRTGTTLNASVSSELIKNIFYPKAPLHDGAVIISDWEIKSAGCLLPLSSNPDISRDLGTRHRAAIGISELYDCLCVVVSEETGTISLAVNGIIKRHLAPETLERLLFNELVPQNESQPKQFSFLEKIRRKS
jgi:diadenylate cyclase